MEGTLQFQTDAEHAEYQAWLDKVKALDILATHQAERDEIRALSDIGASVQEISRDFRLSEGAVVEILETVR